MISLFVSLRLNDCAIRVCSLCCFACFLCIDEKSGSNKPLIPLPNEASNGANNGSESESVISSSSFKEHLFIISYIDNVEFPGIAILAYFDISSSTI